MTLNLVAYVRLEGQGSFVIQDVITGKVIAELDAKLYSDEQDRIWQ